MSQVDSKSSSKQIKILISPTLRDVYNVYSVKLQTKIVARKMSTYITYGRIGNKTSRYLLYLHLYLTKTSISLYFF